MTNLYKVLGVGHNATADEIQAAFRRLAKLTHPDLNPAPDAAQRFMQLNAAYEILSDPARRRLHDQQLAAHEARRQRPASGTGQPPPPPRRPQPTEAERRSYAEALRRARAKAQQQAGMRYEEFDRRSSSPLERGVGIALQVPLMVFSLALCALLMALPFLLMVTFHWAFVFLGALTVPFGISFLKSIRENLRQLWGK